MTFQLYLTDSCFLYIYTHKALVHIQYTRNRKRSLPSSDKREARKMMMGSCFEGEEERLLQMVQDFIESSSYYEPAVSGNFCSCSPAKNDHLKHPTNKSCILQDILRKKTDTEKKVLEKVTQYMKGKREMERNTSLKKWLVMCLRLDGLDASLCHTSWVTKPGCPCGNYEYIDIILQDAEDGVSETRLIVDIDFKSQFEVARPTPTYLQLSDTLPSIFVGNEEKLNRVISILCSAAEVSLKESGLHIPPWRKVNYMQSKWLSDCCKKDPDCNNCFCNGINDHNHVGNSSSSSSGERLSHNMNFGKWVPPSPTTMRVKPKRNIAGGGNGGGGGGSSGCGLLSSQFSNRSINCC